MEASGEVKREVWVIRTGDAVVHVIAHSCIYQQHLSPPTTAYRAALSKVRATNYLPIVRLLIPGPPLKRSILPPIL